MAASPPPVALVFLLTFALVFLFLFLKPRHKKKPSPEAQPPETPAPQTLPKWTPPPSQTPSPPPPHLIGDAEEEEEGAQHKRRKRRGRKKRQEAVGGPDGGEEARVEEAVRRSDVGGREKATDCPFPFSSFASATQRKIKSQYDELVRSNQAKALTVAQIMPGIGGSSSSNDCPNVGQDDNAPLWQYVTKMEKATGGGNIRFQCHYCKQDFKGSYYRVTAHLLKIKGRGIQPCPKVMSEHIIEMQRVVEEAESRLKRAAPKKVSLPTSSAGTSSKETRLSRTAENQMDANLGYDVSLSKRQRQGGDLTSSFNAGARERMHSEIARMFYSAGLPFHLARNPYYVSSYNYAANNSISGYLPPGYNLLRTSLLQKERAHIDNLLQPTKQSWNEKGVTLVADGWTDAQRRPLINFMAVTENGPMFLKAVNCEGEIKDKFFIADLIEKTIMDVGANNVIQVITDNAPVCKAAGMIIESWFPHIFWTPCVVHTLNLALKNICAAKNTEANGVVYEECSWINDIAGDTAFIRTYILNHSMRLAIYNDFNSLKLLSIAETRFASVIVMLRRFKAIKNGLQKMVISDKWSLYRDDDVEKARFVKEKVLDDVWWDQLDFILSFTEPIYDMLRVADTDKPCLHLVYDMWDSMIEKVRSTIYRHEGKRENESSSFYNVVHQILVDRWNKSNTPLHCLAHSLNPRYYSNDWLNEASNRRPPHLDVEISTERNKCIKRYFPSVEDRRIIIAEFSAFSTGTNNFADHDALNDRGAVEPMDWWVTYGTSAPSLLRIALKLLGQPCSSSCCERNWSTYSFINSMKRNKMTPQRAEDLVYVHTNLRLLSRKSPSYTEGETKMWDIGGDGFESGEGAGILEIANLSLDEPELEAIVFTDEGDGCGSDD